MSSKLERHKQIFSLLNSKIVNDNQDFDYIDAAAGLSQDAPGEEQDRLLSQVYQFHKSLIQNINAGLITIDLLGEITFANQVAARLLGFSVKELLGRNLREFFKAAEDGDRFLRSATVVGAQIDNWEAPFRHKREAEIILGINSGYLNDARNHYEGVVLLIRDVTELQQLRHQVERMERLALLGELSAGIAHEIRNPLAGIRAATQLLGEHLGDSDLQTQIIERIIREVDKSNRLLKEFFKFARPTRPKFGFVRLETVVESVFLLLAPRMKKNGIHFIEQFDKQVPPAYADETQLEQVIMNLFLNAIDAMPDGGDLTVSTAQKQMRPPALEKRDAVAEGKMPYVQLLIEDSGHGIPEVEIERVFNPFFTTKPEGVGLGLSICSRLMDENHGTLEASSSVGKGTTFTITAPAFRTTPPVDRKPQK